MQRDSLDARNLLCPLPVIRVQDKVAKMAPGDELEVFCTDPGVLNDIPAWCRINGHTVMETSTLSDEIIVLIRVEKGDK